MADQTQQQGKVPLQRFLKDFRSPLSDGELRDKYGLSARGFVSLIKALLARGTINQEDLVRRKETAVQRDLAKEHEFLAQLYICPHCGHPHPTPYDRCPACGADTSDAFGTADAALDPLTSTGRHFYPDSPGAERDADAEPQDRGSAPAAEGETAAAQQDTASPFKTVRSLISKLTKK
jgi:hypothetical protein